MRTNSKRAAFTLVELPAVSKRGFTLVELLVVIGIIALLAAILLPAINSVLKKGEQTKAQAQVKALATAWKNYYNEYGKWPVIRKVNDYYCLGGVGSVGNKYPANEGPNGSYGIPMSSNLVMLLSPSLYDNKGFQSAQDNDIIAMYNPKRITFLEFDKEAIDQTYSMVDPWGQTNMFMFDMNDDGSVSNRSGTTVYDSVIVWSPGADGISTTMQDNAKSWE